MSKYLKIIGVVELIAFVIGVFYFIDALSAVKSGLMVVLFIMYLFVGPALGVLFWEVGDMIIEKDGLLEKMRASIHDMSDRLSKCEYMIHNNNSIEESKETNNSIINNGLSNEDEEVVTTHERIYSFADVKIDSDMIHIGDNTLNKSLISNIKANDNKISFAFYSTKYIINCSSQKELEDIFGKIK